MPYVSQSSYKPRGLLKSGHLQTLYPTLFRTVEDAQYRHQPRRERMELKDGDFLDLDWHTQNNDKIAILCHGLESCTDATYMQGMAKACQLNGWDSLGFNFRGCSGEPNRRPHAYHCGLTEDLDAVIQYALNTQRYRTLSLIGFSLGGNLVLKYLGEREEHLPPQITSSAAVSVPCDLANCSIRLERLDNWVYKTRFLRLLLAKSLQKKQLISQHLGHWPDNSIRSIKDFDEHFTAPLNNFRDADHYYQTTSSLNFLSRIKRPTLLLNAKNDPLLGNNCYPYREAESNPFLYLETPCHGGHVGFMQSHAQGLYWHEERIMAFINDNQLKPAPNPVLD